jgi:DNA/RNA-binding domain of Phe-tRNA-synthetase-like protein
VNEGGVDPAVASEFPDLRLWWEELGGGTVRSSDGVRERLRLMSERYTGAKAVALRAQPIPHAYRVFFRHIGLDPDTDRIPVESVVVERLKAGAFKSRSLLEDALTIACIETSIGVWACDAATLEGELSIRPAFEGEPLDPDDRHTPWLPSGRLIVADASGPVAVLFGDVVAGHAVTRDTRSVVLFAVQVAGVPAIHLEEAFWTVAELLEPERR